MRRDCEAEAARDGAGMETYLAQLGSRMDVLFYRLEDGAVLFEEGAVEAAAAALQRGIMTGGGRIRSGGFGGGRIHAEQRVVIGRSVGLGPVVDGRVYRYQHDTKLQVISSDYRVCSDFDGERPGCESQAEGIVTRAVKREGTAKTLVWRAGCGVL
jgi:hypothetical protein